MTDSVPDSPASFDEKALSDALERELDPTVGRAMLHIVQRELAKLPSAPKSSNLEIHLGGGKVLPLKRFLYKSALEIAKLAWSALKQNWVEAAEKTVKLMAELPAHIQTLPTDSVEFRVYTALILLGGSRGEVAVPVESVASALVGAYGADVAAQVPAVLEQLAAKHLVELSNGCYRVSW